MKCRHCAHALTHTFLDLGFAPPSNAYLTASDLHQPETYFPLKVKVCHHCWLVQTEDYTSSESLFRADYAYFSSTSSGWLAHAKKYATKIIERLQLHQNSLVMEVASNDGYLLRNFIATGIPCLGIEPTASTAAAAEKLGIPVIQEFFSEQLAKKLALQGQTADLIVANNVYAHVPDINDFTRGLKAVLKPGGTITLEFPHVMRLIEHNQFDTIYHEHFSYLSLYTVHQIFDAAGLHIWDVEELPTHGGSLRVYGGHAEEHKHRTPAVASLLEAEASSGLQTLSTYQHFQAKADRVKNDLLAFLIEQNRLGKTIAAYGAAAKGNTLLNYAGVRPDLLPFVCDAATAKQNKYMPGSHIPIRAPSELNQQRPDFLIILPWNIASEVKHQTAALAALGTKYVTAVPFLEIT